MSLEDDEDKKQTMDGDSATSTLEGGAVPSPNEKQDIEEKAASVPVHGPVSQRLNDIQGVAVDGSRIQHVEGKYREKWYQIYRPKNPPPPPPLSLDDAGILPLATANIFQVLTFTWISPIMTLGYQRPLQATDLWKMDPSRESTHLASNLTAAWDARQAKARAFNESKLPSAVPSLFTRAKWIVGMGLAGNVPKEEWKQLDREGKVMKWRTSWEKEGGGKQRASLAWSMNAGIAFFFWTGGLFKVVGDTAQLCGPLITKQIILFAQEKAADPEGKVNYGKGFALALGLFLITVFASVSQHQFFWRSMSVGVLTRASLSTAVYQKSMVLAQSERVHFTNGKLLNHLSTDISRIDYAAQWFHAWWTSPIQLIICMVLLLLQIGPSALVGMSLFAILTPVQTRIMRMQFQVRKKSMKWTDMRSRLLQEVLGSFGIIKYFTFEVPFLKKIAYIRGEELKGIKSILLIRAANQAIAMSLPTLAAVVSFICYSGTGHDLNPAKIFTALSLFQLLRQPLMFLPRALSAIADASNAIDRLSAVFEAQTMDDTDNLYPDLDVALRVTNATFQWSSAEPEADLIAQAGKKANGKKKEKKNEKKNEIKKNEAEGKEKKEPFMVKDLNMEVKRGDLIVICGAVGSGKSSILQGLIGEMKQVSGQVQFGGKVAYCSQVSFIQNATLRENVLFGQPFDEERYWQAITDASLVADCELLPDGDLSEIGEKGINLSGGQKQRVNVARALYFGADIVIFDDPLSAVDAHVAQALFNNAMIGALKNAGKTIILVTHALHFLPQADYIYTIDNGNIVEAGTFQDLSSRNGPFQKLVEEFGGAAEKEDEEEEILEEKAILAATHPNKKTAREKITNKTAGKAAGTGKLEGRLMKQEKREVGKVNGAVYKNYISAGKGYITLPLVALSSVFMQGSQIMSSVWLVYWQETKWPQRSLAFYMGLYAMLGLLQATFTFFMGGAIAIMSYFASGTLHHRSIQRVFYAPMAFFQETPLGRIMGVLGKDIDTIDNQLADSVRMSTMVLGNVLGSTILIAIYFPYFLIAVVVILFGYGYFWVYYRTSARELKRLDAMLRSILYSHFSESLGGLATIRAYGESRRFLKDNAYYMDLEDRSYFLVQTNQRWLAIRLDALGACMSFAVGMMAVFGVQGISSAEIGLVLSFCVGLTQQFGMITRQTAEVENNMNAVERVTHYSSEEMKQEAPPFIEATQPPPEWPANGAIDFNNIVLAYKPTLPPVLKGIDLHITGGMKVGICGRTGAGKSSIMAALFRIVELQSGSIVIDGVDIKTLGLNSLRSKLSIIPQDPQLFSGTIRTNLDPFSQHEDIHLWEALRKAHLSEESASTGDARFTLDSPVDDDGGNLSVGERSLVSLARALVKDSRIIVLDEMTASVDLETDAKIQKTISREFSDKTLLCIAHRLRTIINYDRILVLDAGEVAEFDTPLNLFLQNGIFRSMCDKSNITEGDFDAPF